MMVMTKHLAKNSHVIPLQNLKCHPKMVTGIQIPLQGSGQTAHPDQDCNENNKIINFKIPGQNLVLITTFNARLTSH